MSYLTDVRYGLRMLRKQPGLSLMAILALGLGIGLPTIMFSIVQGALLRGLPFPDAHELLHLERSNETQNAVSIEVPQHDYLDWQAQQTSFEQLIGFDMESYNLSGPEDLPERLSGASVDVETFRMLGIQPQLGRDLTAEDAELDAEPVALLGFDLWQNRFAGDDGIVGRKVRLSGQDVTVIGIMPPKFKFPIFQEVWRPLQIDLSDLQRGEGRTLEVVGRLRDGVSTAQARAEMNAIASRLAQQYPDTNEGVGVVVKSYVEEFIGGETPRLLYVMLGAVMLVLLVACANVANLLLSRTAARTKEVALRSALGASKGRVVGQLLTETLLLAIAGGALGLLIAHIGITAFSRAIIDTDPPFWIDIRLDPTVLLFALGLALVSCLAAGLAPALQAASTDANAALKDEGRGSSSLRMGRLSRGLVIAEIALSCALLVAAGLMIKSVVQLQQLDFVFDTEEVLIGDVTPEAGDYAEDADRNRLQEELLERLRHQPGVAAAALTSAAPAQGTSRYYFGFEGKTYANDHDHPTARRAVIAGDFFQVLGVQPIAGRVFRPSDTADSQPVVVVNQSFVRKHFEDRSPLGERLRIGTGTSTGEYPWRTIVGVVPDLMMGGLETKDFPEGMYMPAVQNPDLRFTILLRSAGPPPSELASMVRQQVSELDATMPVSGLRSLAAAILASGWFYNVFGSLFTAFGAAALLLAAVGLYGVMAFSVRRRTQELGVRMALGARGADVVRMVLTQGLKQLALGLLVGIPVALGLSRMIAALLYQVEPWDPGIFALIAITLTTVATLACLVPARRAARVDPVTALRTE